MITTNSLTNNADYSGSRWAVISALEAPKSNVEQPGAYRADHE